MRFHAHIYFLSSQKEQAIHLHGLIKKNLNHSYQKLSELNLEPRGPHPTPTFEVHFEENEREKFKQFFVSYRQDLSVLIHPDTGDDHQDHSVGIEWIGSPVVLDFGFFDRIKKDPSLKINP